MSKLAEPVGCNTVGTVSFLFGLIGGTGSSIVIKMLYQLSAKDSEGQVRHFEKPLFLTFTMFLAMAGALPMYHLQQRLKEPSERAPRVPGRVLWWLIVPSVFDLAGTNFAQIGLLFTTVSYFQLLRCTVIVVTAFLKAFVLKQRLASYMWWGVAINIVAMVMVSVTNFIDAGNAQPDGASNPALGAFFILMSCIVQGSQYIFEEKVMAVDDAPPLVVIGMEGVWGTIIMLVIFPIAAMLPGRDLGSVENSVDSFYMLSQSSAIQVMLLVFFITITVYNIFCIYVTAYLSAIWHAILDNFRPVSVWSTDLVIYYCLTNGAFGEAWTRYSWLQFSGMMILFVGTAVYNGSLKLPFVTYDDQHTSLPGEQTTPGMRAPESLATSSLMKSPLLRRVSREYESPAGALTLAARAAARRAADAAAVLDGDGNRRRALSSETQGLVGYGKPGGIDGAGDTEYGTGRT